MVWVGRQIELVLLISQQWFVKCWVLTMESLKYTILYGKVIKWDWKAQV